MRRMLAVVPVLGAVTAALVFIGIRDSDTLTDEDRAPIEALADVDDALRWREQAEANAGPYRDMEAAEQLGYWRLHDSAYGPWEHLIKWDAVEDDRILDPSEPEILVYRAENNTFELQAFAFILPERYHLGNTSDIAEGSGVWHTHPVICIAGDPFLDPAAGRLVGTLADERGDCPSGINFPDVLMVHAWLAPNPCGPFAPSLGDIDAEFDRIGDALSGVDADGKTPGCDTDLARRVWGG